MAPAQLFDMSNLNIIGYAGCTGYIGYVGYTCLEMVSNWNMYHGDCCNGEVWEAHILWVGSIGKLINPDIVTILKSTFRRMVWTDAATVVRKVRERVRRERVRVRVREKERERVSRTKIKVREKVEKSRNTVFFQ